MSSSLTRSSARQASISSAELLLLAQGSPAGLAWTASLRSPQADDVPELPDWFGEQTAPSEGFSRFALPAHVDYLNRCLVRLAAREYLREGYLGLIVEMPPRHGKSELASAWDSAWYLGAFPGHRIVLASYEADFASGWGRRARDMLEEWGPGIFGISVNPRSSAADRWDIRGHSGGMATAGAGGAMTGRGANYLKIDDPIKNAIEAQSQARRDTIWDWWRSVARTRIEPGGVALVIGTRWHEDDLIGRLLRAMAEDPEADRWVRIRFPAIAEDDDVLGRTPGEALWRERYDEDALRRTRASVGAYVWSALYQQRPAPKSGGKFQRDWFEVIERPPLWLNRVIRFWDLAATDAAAASDPDRTAGVKVGITPAGELVVLDVALAQRGPAGVEQLVRETAELDGRNVPIWIEEERGSAGKHTVSHYARNVLQGYVVRGERVTGNKELRADLVAAAAERREVKLVRGPWNEAFLEEHELFPFGPHDDVVDATSGAVRQLTQGAGRGYGF